jgi:RHS repeat-associated protein
LEPESGQDLRVPAAPDHAPTLAAPGRRRPPQRAAQKNSRRGFFGSPSGRTLSRRHLPHGTAPGYRACGYKTASGRPKWLSRDPLGEFGGVNLYGYVANNSLNWTDPFGLVCPSPEGIPTPPTKIPGGPWDWSPNPQNARGGDFIGPKQFSGPRARLTFSPPTRINKDPYWKSTDPNGKQVRWNLDGEPISPDEAHPGPGFFRFFEQFLLILPAAGMEIFIPIAVPDTSQCDRNRTT